MKDDLKNKRVQAETDLNKRKDNPMSAKEMGRKVKDAKKFHEKVGKNQRKTIEASAGRQNLATGGVQSMVKEAGIAASCDKDSCGRTSPAAKKVYDAFMKGKAKRKGKAHDKLMKNK